jgi:hypothetical protein
MLIAMSVLMGGDLASIDESSPDKALKAILSIAPRLAAISVLNYFFQAFTHCVTIAMAMDMAAKGSCNVFDGYLSALRKFGSIFSAAFLILVLLAVGLMLLILPALIVSFAFMPVFVIIMAEDINPVAAMKKSYRTMKGNFSNSIVLFFFLAAVGISVSVVNMLLGQMLYIGVVFSLFLSGIFMSFTAVALLKFYTILEIKRPVALL